VPEPSFLLLRPAFTRKRYHPGRPFIPAPLLFQNKQNSKNKGGKNKASQGKIKKRVSGNGHGLPHFIAIIRVAIAEIRAETATTHVAAPSFLSFFGFGAALPGLSPLPWGGGTGRY
jgi:hypothetical protein